MTVDRRERVKRLLSLADTAARAGVNVPIRLITGAADRLVLEADRADVAPIVRAELDRMARAR